MKNAFKKFLAMIAVFSVFLSSDFHAFAAAIHDMSHNLEVAEDIIVSQALDLDSNSKLGNKNFSARDAIYSKGYDARGCEAHAREKNG